MSQQLQLQRLLSPKASATQARVPSTFDLAAVLQPIRDESLKVADRAFRPHLRFKCKSLKFGPTVYASGRASSLPQSELVAEVLGPHRFSAQALLNPAKHICVSLRPLTILSQVILYLGSRCANLSGKVIIECLQTCTTMELASREMACTKSLKADARLTRQIGCHL